MADSYTLRLNKIDQFLKENEEMNWKSRDPYWSKLFIETHLKLLKAYVFYTGKWSDKDKAKHLGWSPSTTDPEAQLNKDFATYVSEVIFTRPDHANETMRWIHFMDIWVPLDFQAKVAKTYDHLLGSPHPHPPPISDYLVFSQFAACVQDYVVSLWSELERYVQCGWGGSPCEWLTSNYSSAQRNYTTTAEKLESFSSFVYGYARRCVGREKSHDYLGRAGALLFGVAGEACAIQAIDRNSWSYPFIMVSYSSDLSRKLSGHNREVVEIYSDVLGAYVGIIEGSGSGCGPGSSVSMTFEDLIGSYVTLLHILEDQVDILAFVIDNLSLNLVVKQELHLIKEVDLLLRSGVVAVAGEAGSLSSTPPNIGLSKLWHKLNLIRAEIFVLELHNQKDNLMVSAYNPVASIGDAFRFLSRFFKTPEVYMEEDRGKLVLATIEGLLREARSSLSDSHQAQQLTDDEIFKSSLAIFKVFKAEAMLLVLIDNENSLKFMARYCIGTLHKSLIFLRALLSDSPNGDLEDGELSTIIAELASKATNLVCSFGSNRTQKNQLKDMALLPTYLARKIKLNYTVIKEVYRQHPLSLFSYFPKSDGLFFVGSLLAKQREFLEIIPDIQFELLVQGLEFLLSLIKAVQQKNNEIADLGKRVICLIYEAEYIINLFVDGDVPVWYQQLMLYNAIEETNAIKVQIQEYCQDKEKCDRGVLNARQTLGNLTIWETKDQRTDEVIVGFDEQAKIVVNQLETGSQQLQIVSIVGMAGLGKTTLAKKVYHTLSIQHRFTVRAWCYVSQVYQTRKLLLSILGSFIEVNDQIKGMDDEDIARMLYRKLKGKRYLVVIDDIWSLDPWNDLKISLPDDRMGSRILFTSRVRKVALPREPHLLPFLSIDKSWDLLKGKLFHGGSCPDQLLGVGRLIAENCKGLPLAIVVIAGLLKKIGNRKEQWEEIAEHLRSHIADDQESKFMDILEFSYNHLPSYLKPCFLYFGIFLEDHEISVQKLKRLWIAEGFIPKMASNSLEETAEAYLVELTDRSLVMEAKKRSRGGTKTCRIHDMLRDLCLEKARKENFMQLISMSDTGNSDSLISILYRLCVHSSRQYFIRSEPFGPNVHSLHFFPTNKDCILPSDVSFIFQNFKLLRVLDLEYINIDNPYLSGIELMFCLTYLAVRGNVTSVPTSLIQLFNLETLILKGTRGEIAVPSTLFRMPKLRHVEVHPRAAFSFSNELENSTVLDNLVILSSPTLCQGEEAENLLRRLVGLKKLRCIFLKNWDNFKMCNVFPDMGFLDRLESLKIFYHDKISLPCKFSFPQNLKKLTLSKFRLPWEYVSAIRQLNNLEVLKFLSNAFEGPTWDMTEGEFPNLKFLMLEHLNLESWNASSDHFPQLERLVVQSCKKLKEVPYSFGEICTLQVIEMHWCSPSATNSVEAISEQQLEFGNKEFNVLINRSVHI